MQIDSLPPPPRPRLSAPILADVVAREIELPVLPDIAARVIRMAEGNTASPADLARIIEADAGLTSRVVRLCNCAAFGLRRKATTLQQAISLLGMRLVKQIVVATSMRYLFRELGPVERQMLDHAVSIALATRVLANTLRLDCAEEAFLAGQLHDVGHLVMHNEVTKRYLAAREASHGLESVFIEQRILGYSHPDVGALVLRSWDFSPAVEAAAFYHHDVELAAAVAARHAPLVAAVALAELIVTPGMDFTETPRDLDCALDLLRLDSGALVELSVTVNEVLAQEKAAFLL